MTYNRSEIMKAAWRTYTNVRNHWIRRLKSLSGDGAVDMEVLRENAKPFSLCLKESWKKAKDEAEAAAYREERKLFEAVYASELKASDVVDVEYGIGPGFTAKREIASISEASNSTAWEIAVRYLEGIKNFPGADTVNCFKPNDIVRRLKAA